MWSLVAQKILISRKHHPPFIRRSANKKVDLLDRVRSRGGCEGRFVQASNLMSSSKGMSADFTLKAHFPRHSEHVTGMPVGGVGRGTSQNTPKSMGPTKVTPYCRGVYAFDRKTPLEVLEGFGWCRWSMFI